MHGHINIKVNNKELKAHWNANFKIKLMPSVDIIQQRGSKQTQLKKRKHLMDKNKPLRNTFHGSWFLRTAIKYSDRFSHNPNHSLSSRLLFYFSVILSYVCVYIYIYIYNEALKAVHG